MNKQPSQQAKTREIPLLAFADKDVTIKVNGATVTASPQSKVTVTHGDTRIEISAEGSILAYTNRPIETRPVADSTDTAPPEAYTGDVSKEGLKIGERRAADGTIYAGISSIIGANGKWYDFDLYAAPQDLKSSNRRNLTETWREASARVSKLKDFFNHAGSRVRIEEELCENPVRYDGGWMLPTRAESQKLYDNKDIGAFHGSFETTAFPAHWYWSSTVHDRLMPPLVWFQSFRYGSADLDNKDNSSASVRPVRRELRRRRPSPYAF